MEKTRLEFLQVAVFEQPANTFARYGLAMELAQTGDPLEAWRHFDYLLTHHPDYSPAYYQAGVFLVRQGRYEEASKVFAKGIEVTGRQGNSHAQSELQAALDDLRGRRAKS